MCAAERVILAVGERKIFLVGGDVGMSESAFEVAFFDMNDRVGAGLEFADLTCQQVEEAVFSLIFLAVEDEGEAAIEEEINPIIRISAAQLML